MNTWLAHRLGLSALLGDLDPVQQWWAFGQVWVALHRAQAQIDCRRILREEMPS